MAGIFDRLRPTHETVKRIPVQRLQNNFWQLNEGYIDREGLLARFDITDPVEVADIDALLTFVGAKLAGKSQQVQKAERVNMFHEFWNVLMAVESGDLSEVQARTRLGI